MTNFFTYAAIVIGLSATATLALNNRSVQTKAAPDLRFATDAAFRDGLYLGKLAAQTRQLRPAPTGRWSTGHDRALFAAGYQRGYHDSLPAGRNRAEAQ